MMKSMTWIVIALVTVLVLTGCRKSDGGAVAPTTYSISGVVASSGIGVEGVIMSLNSTISTTTDASGVYTFTGLSAGTYTLTPGKAGYAFSPCNGSVTVNSQDITGMEFAATDQPASVSGFVADDPIVGAEVLVKSALNDKALGTGTTDGSGSYVINVFSQPPYRITTSGGTSLGSPFPGALTAYCETGDDCHASPYTSTVDLLMQDYGLGYSEAAAAIMNRFGINYDPFLLQRFRGGQKRTFAIWPLTRDLSGYTRRSPRGSVR